MKLLTGSMSLLVVALMSFQATQNKKPAATSGLAKKTTPAVKPVVTISAKDRGKLVYMKQCLVCHQADGSGVPHMNAPLDGATAVQGKDKAKLIRIVLKGMNDRVEIDGDFYANNMAPHPELTDQQIADVLTYVRSNWTNKASAVTPAEVKAVRAKTK